MKAEIRSLVLLALSVLMAGCHGVSQGSITQKWVNSQESGQVLELSFPSLSVLGHVHVAVFGTELHGTYVLRNGEQSTEGRATNEGGTVTLIMPDGAQRQLYLKDSSTLQSESGETWKAARPSAASEMPAELHKW